MVNARKTETTNPPDLIRELGVLAFATRLRRLGEWLQRDVSRLYVEQALDFEARWFPVLYALKGGGNRSVTSLARSLRLTHPAVTQIAGQMARRGFLASRRDPHDERRRLLRLTPAGRRLATTLEPIFNEICQATTEVLDQTGCDLLSVLDKIESALDENDIYSRVLRHRRKQQRGQADNRPSRLSGGPTTAPRGKK